VFGQTTEMQREEEKAEDNLHKALKIRMTKFSYQDWHKKT